MRFSVSAIGIFALYGRMAGAVRRIAGGVPAPRFAHVFADAVIGTILVTSLR